MLSILKQQEETWFNFIALLYWMVCLSSSTFLNHCLIVSPPDATFSSTLWSRCSKGSPCRRFDIAFFWETGERRLFTFHLKTTCPSLPSLSLSLSFSCKSKRESVERERRSLFSSLVFPLSIFYFEKWPFCYPFRRISQQRYVSSTHWLVHHRTDDQSSESRDLFLWFALSLVIHLIQGMLLHMHSCRHSRVRVTDTGMHCF